MSKRLHCCSIEAYVPLLPDGLNVAIGARATANSGSAPGTSLASIDDGDATTRWCPARWASTA